MKFKAGDVVFIGGKSRGKSLVDFTQKCDKCNLDKNGLPKNKFRIEYIDYEEQCNVILGDWFTDEDLSPFKRVAQQLSLFGG